MASHGATIKISDFKLSTFGHTKKLKPEEEGCPLPALIILGDDSSKN